MDSPFGLKSPTERLIRIRNPAGAEVPGPSGSQGQPFCRLDPYCNRANHLCAAATCAAQHHPANRTNVDILNPLQDKPESMSQHARLPAENPAHPQLALTGCPPRITAPSDRFPPCPRLHCCPAHRWQQRRAGSSQDRYSPAPFARQPPADPHPRSGIFCQAGGMLAGQSDRQCRKLVQDAHASGMQTARAKVMFRTNNSPRPRKRIFKPWKRLDKSAPELALGSAITRDLAGLCDRRELSKRLRLGNAPHGHKPRRAKPTRRKRRALEDPSPRPASNRQAIRREIFIPLRLQPPPEGVRGLDYPLAMAGFPTLGPARLVSTPSALARGRNGLARDCHQHNL